MLGKLTLTDDQLKAVARAIRFDTVAAIGHLGVGHIGGSLSVVELLTAL